VLPCVVLETHPEAVYNEAMENKNRKIIAYVIACVSEFARATNLNTQESFKYLNTYGGIDFLLEHYEAEHLLSFDDAVDDLRLITRTAGGHI